MDTKTTISQELYQFTDEVALIIVAAKQEGRIFRAGNGELELIEEFRIPTPHFSDNEGIPSERGDQANLLEVKIHKEYFEHFKNSLHALSSTLKPTHLYFFAPAHVADELAKITTPIFGAFPTKTIVGIFTKESPFELLGRI